MTALAELLLACRSAGAGAWRRVAARVVPQFLRGEGGIHWRRNSGCKLQGQYMQLDQLPPTCSMAGGFLEPSKRHVLVHLDCLWRPHSLRDRQSTRPHPRLDARSVDRTAAARWLRVRPEVAAPRHLAATATRGTHPTLGKGIECRGDPWKACCRKYPP
jgi:hypothetical protein